MKVMLGYNSQHENGVGLKKSEYYSAEFEKLASKWC